LNLRREDSLLQTSLNELEHDLKRFVTFCRIDSARVCDCPSASSMV
jgi:hypothetical protein